MLKLFTPRHCLSIPIMMYWLGESNILVVSGSAAYNKEMQVRSALESDLLTVNLKLKEIGTRLQNSPNIEF